MRALKQVVLRRGEEKGGKTVIDKKSSIRTLVLNECVHLSISNAPFVDLLSISQLLKVNSRAQRKSLLSIKYHTQIYFGDIL